MLNKNVYALIGAFVLLAAISASSAQENDDDDEGYGPQNDGNQDSDSYANTPQVNNNYGAADAGYGNNGAGGAYQPNVDADGSNYQPNAYQIQAGGSDADGDDDSDDNSAVASEIVPVAVKRVRRSLPVASTNVEQASVAKPEAAASQAKLRVKRHGKHYIGPVYTYVKTDKKANFKWGVKHKVGKKHHG